MCAQAGRARVSGAGEEPAGKLGHPGPGRQRVADIATGDLGLGERL